MSAFRRVLVASRRLPIPRSQRVRYLAGSPREDPSQKGGPISFSSLFAMGLAGMGILAFYNYEKQQKIKTVQKEIKTVGKPALGGPYVLVDQHGVPCTDATFQGKFCLLYFGFSYCPDICPSELVKVGNIMKSLEAKGFDGLRPVFISVDPPRDSVGQLQHYSQDFHPKIAYLTGTVDQVGAAARAYRVYFSKASDGEQTDEDDYLVDHSIVLYLLSPEGEFLEFFTQRVQAGDIVDKILKYATAHDKIKRKEKTDN